MRRLAIGLAATVELPDAVGSVSVTGHALQQTGPRMETLDFVVAGVENAFVSGFRVNGWHRRCCLTSCANNLDHFRHAGPIAMAGLEHVEIENAQVAHRVSGGLHR